MTAKPPAAQPQDKPLNYRSIVDNSGNENDFMIKARQASAVYLPRDEDEDAIPPL